MFLEIMIDMTNLIDVMCVVTSTYRATRKHNTVSSDIYTPNTGVVSFTLRRKCHFCTALWKFPHWLAYIQHYNIRSFNWTHFHGLIVSLCDGVVFLINVQPVQKIIWGWRTMLCYLFLHLPGFFWNRILSFHKFIFNKLINYTIKF